MDENKLSSNAFIGETCVPLKNLINRPVQRFRRLLDEQSDVILSFIYTLCFASFCDLSFVICDDKYN